MEKYVKSAILKSKQNVTKDFLEKNLAGRKRLASMNEIEAGKQDDGEDNQSGNGTTEKTPGLESNATLDDIDTNRSRLKRMLEHEVTGTGRYDPATTNELRSCIATEKGLLTHEDFEHIQKVIEVYSKALLCEIR